MEYAERGALRKSEPPHNFALTMPLTANQLFAMVRFSIHLTVTFSNSLFQALSIAKGVCYLHDKDIVHGDIKAVSLTHRKMTRDR